MPCARCPYACSIFMPLLLLWWMPMHNFKCQGSIVYSGEQAWVSLLVVLALTVDFP